MKLIHINSEWRKGSYYFFKLHIHFDVIQIWILRILLAKLFYLNYWSLSSSFYLLFFSLPSLLSLFLSFLLFILSLYCRTITYHCGAVFSNPIGMACRERKRRRNGRGTKRRERVSPTQSCSNCVGYAFLSHQKYYTLILQLLLYYIYYDTSTSKHSALFWCQLITIITYFMEYCTLLWSTFKMILSLFFYFFLLRMNYFTATLFGRIEKGNRATFQFLSKNSIFIY